MNAKLLLLLLVCAAVAAAGCTSGTPPAQNTQLTPPATVTGTPFQSCTTDSDCVPAQCCHPTGCTLKGIAPDCSAKLCTESCEGPIDCGSGSCGYVSGTCTVIPARTTITLTASPQRYSPVMSSTPGIALTPHVIGFVPNETYPGQNMSDIKWDPLNYEWNATFGEFLLWREPDHAVDRIGNPAATDAATVYWSFTETPSSIKGPVRITLTVRDMTRQGAVLGTSSVTLDWDGNTAVYVGKIT